jgi:hypothetical protein
LAYDERLRTQVLEHGAIDGVSSLAALKAAIYEVAAHIDETQCTTADGPGHLDTTSSTALKILSSIHRGTIASITQLKHRLPHTWVTEITPGGGTLAQAELKLRDKAVALAKEELVRDMQGLQDDAHELDLTEVLDDDTNGSRRPAQQAPPRQKTRTAPTEKPDSKSSGVEADSAQKLARKNSIRRRLAQLHRQVQTSGLHFLRTETDEILSDPASMARELATHWSKVFTAHPVDHSLLEQWFDKAEQHGSRRVEVSEDAWRVRRKDITRALDNSADTRPGPDGIPYRAWRALGPLSIATLWSAARRLEQPLNPKNPDHQAFNGSILCCLPKVGSSVHEDGREIHKASETRPLTITDCSNRLIANAYRYRWEGLIAPIIDASQRGFLPGRSMLQNVVDIEHKAMLTALAEDDGAIILFDFVAAFPSISRHFLHKAADRAGLPPNALQVIESFYYRTTSKILIQGCLYDEINITAGIRQGCPLSPLLFALATDSLMKVLRGRHPTATTHAFADDTAMVIRSWKTDSPAIFRTFDAYRRASHLALNLAKTKVIPLWPTDVRAIQAETAANSTWPQVSWATTAKYLGFWVGPNGHETSWIRPREKCLQRLSEWHWSEMGLHPAMETYGIYVASVLTFVAQLQRPPDDLHNLESTAVRRIAPGPGNWCSVNDLKFGTFLGLHASLRPLHETCEAVMMRTFHWEAHSQGGIPWRHLHSQLQDALRKSDKVFLQASWARWFASHTPTVMLALHDKWSNVGVEVSSLRRNIGGAGHGPLDRRQEQRLRRRTQGWFAREFLAHKKFDVHARLRHRLQRWRLPGMPRKNADCVAKQLRQLRKLVPPRVSAAVLSTIFNIWTTARRMRHIRNTESSCVLECSTTAADSIEHYVHCPVWRKWQRARLQNRLEHSTLQHFMLATPMRKDRLSLQAAGVYVLYRTVNHLRHNPPMPKGAFDMYVWHYMHQMLHEAIRGHSFLTLHVVGNPDKRRKRSASTPGSSRVVRRRI